MIKFNIITFILSSNSKEDIAIEFTKMGSLYMSIAEEVRGRCFNLFNRKELRRYQVKIDIDFISRPATVSYAFHINEDDKNEESLIEKTEVIKQSFLRFNEYCSKLDNYSSAKELYVKQMDFTDNPAYLAVDSLIVRDILTLIISKLPSAPYGIEFTLFNDIKKYSCPRLYKKPEEYFRDDTLIGNISLCAFDNHIQYISQQKAKRQNIAFRKSADNYNRPIDYDVISITANQRSELEKIFQREPSAVYAKFNLHVKVFSRMAYGLEQSKPRYHLLSFSCLHDQLEF